MFNGAQIVADFNAGLLTAEAALKIVGVEYDLLKAAGRSVDHLNQFIGEILKMPPEPADDAESKAWGLEYFE